jgi:histidinol-phosphate phosphatase family protein
MRRAVFLDRDGTINEDRGYVHDREDLVLLPGAAEGIGRLNGTGMPVFVITNQSGVGRGYYTRADVEAFHARMRESLAGRGARIDGIAYCPHHPDDGCACRKPRPGMMEALARQHGVDLGASFVVGDAASDLEAARNVGACPILVRTGLGQRTLEALEGLAVQPAYIARDLDEAARWIVGQAVPVTTIGEGRGV